MKIAVILNRDGGTLRTLDADDLVAGLTETLERHGHTVQTRLACGEGLAEALKAAVGSDADVIMAGGGDGTISAAAALLMDTGKALAVLPAGTMNLFARSLGVPLDLKQAAEAFATGIIRPVDMASANGQPFVHQFSIGLHPKLIDLRERLSFRSRIGKIFASIRAALGAFLKPPRLRIVLQMPDREVKARTSGIGVTNNLFGEGHLPYTEWPGQGVLGIYVTKAQQRRDLLVFLANLALGRWRRNTQVEIYTAREVILHVSSKASRFKCAMDGELRPLSRTTLLKIHPGALNVLVPAPDRPE